MRRAVSSRTPGFRAGIEGAFGVLRRVADEACLVKAESDSELWVVGGVLATTHEDCSAVDGTDHWQTKRRLTISLRPFVVGGKRPPQVRCNTMCPTDRFMRKMTAFSPDLLAAASILIHFV